MAEHNEVLSAHADNPKGPPDDQLGDVCAVPVTQLDLDEDASPGNRRHWTRRQEEAPQGTGLGLELLKLVIPILLAWGVAHVTATGAIATEVAVIKATEQNHFEEIQRTLRRMDEYIARQESRGH